MDLGGQEHNKLVKVKKCTECKHGLRLRVDLETVVFFRARSTSYYFRQSVFIDVDSYIPNSKNFKKDI